MYELMTTANLVDSTEFDEGGALTAVLARTELEAALSSEDSAQLWFDLGYEGYEEIKRLTVNIDSGDLERMLERSSGDDVVVALDRDAVVGLYDEPEVEGHGLRGALAIAVTTAAIAAPAGQAAVGVETSGTLPERAGVELASNPATNVEVSHGVASTIEVSHGIAGATVAKAVEWNKISKTLLVRANGLQFLHSGLLR